jgi:anhydro-N-acetylmuramic acid kinase
MQKNSYTVIGVMSGTSLDGVDLAFLHFHFDTDKWTFEIGVAETQILTLEKQIKKLREDKTMLINDLDTIEQKETALVATLQTKYGTGSIDPESGEITPA